MKVLVVADDATGALEVAAACVDHGLPCRVGGGPQASDGAHVVDLDSRRLPASGVAALPGGAAVRACMGAAPEAVPVLKMDSTLRGNWPTELGLLLQHTGRTRAVVVPAYPAAGRTCVEGRVRVDGVPVHQTAFASDPHHPIRESRVSAYLDGLDAQVVDAETDADVAAAVATVGTDAVLAGPASATAAVAAALGAPVQPPAVPDGPWLVVCGSLHPVARAQVERARAGGHAVLRTADARQADGDQQLARLVVQVHARAHAGATQLFVLGGDTLRALVGSSPMRAVGTVAPGTVLADTRMAGRRVTLLSKPGGFGRPELIVDLLGGGV
jgi:D-threonate/D-erythronate kinase